MNWYLKCYYWYKNRWDELLFFGIIKRIFKNYKINNLYVESGNINRMRERIALNKTELGSKLLEKIIIVEKNDYNKLGSNLKLFLWGWELFTDQRPFPYDWWNYLLKFRKYIYKENVVMIWGIGKPRKFITKILYNLTLRKAEKIIVRENTSFKLVQKYNKNTELYHDFALDVMNDCKWWIRIDDWNYIVINVNSHIMKSQENINKIMNFINKYKWIQTYFFPCDMCDDLKYFGFWKNKISNLEIYDRTKWTVKKTLNFLAWSRDSIWTRLHFLLVLKYFGKKFEPIVYQEKIQKLILE